ncbi:MAG: diacylglycerol kinase family protein [Gemmataceae bacterium]
MTRPPTCVIYNPAAGRGRAARRFTALRRDYAGVAEFRPTERPGHAIELAYAAARRGFERVVAFGGDGTVHEVANGILASGLTDVVFATWPGGSMNDYAFSTGLKGWWVGQPAVPPQTVQADVLRIWDGRRERFAVNGFGFGFNGAVTVESRKIRRLRGHLLYATAFLRAAWWKYATPLVTVNIDGQEIVDQTLAFSVSVGQREGGFRLFPNARLDDGWADILFVGAVKRWELARYLPGLLAGRLPVGHPHLRTGVCRAARVMSETPLCAHADGELICTPEDAVHELSVELCPGRLRVEVCPTSRPVIGG